MKSSPSVTRNSPRIIRAASSPSVVCVGGIRMSIRASSGRYFRTSAVSACPSPHWPMTSKPERSSTLVSPSRRRTSSSATTARVRTAPIRWIISYRRAGLVAGLGHAIEVDRLMEDLLQTRSDDLARLAGEQAALRRVATLAASGVPAQELLAVVSEEVGQLLAVDIAGLTRYEPEGDLSVVAAWSRAGIQVPTPRRWSLGGEDVSTIVAQTKRSARIDRFGNAGVAFPELGMRAAVGVPVIVEGQLWGTMVV